MTVASLNFEHVPANMFLVPCGIMYGADVTWSDFITKNLIPVTLGNWIGAVLLVGALYTYIHYGFVKEKVK